MVLMQTTTSALATLCTIVTAVSLPLPASAAPTEVVLTSESPAQAIQKAINSDPELAKVARDSNSTQQLYLLKTVSYSTGTAADLDLPPENQLPEGAPDRVEEADVTVYSSPPRNESVRKNEETPGSLDILASPKEQMSTKLQLVPIAL